MRSCGASTKGHQDDPTCTVSPDDKSLSPIVKKLADALVRLEQYLSERPKPEGVDDVSGDHASI
jgi:hypothetical protein